jgi:septal ring factor EnvC (AmiA/AmiB activator)
MRLKQQTKLNLRLDASHAGPMIGYVRIMFLTCARFFRGMRMTNAPSIVANTIFLRSIRMALAAGIFAWQLFALPLIAQPSQQATIRAALLNVRSGPAIKHRIVNRLEKGTQVRVLARDHGWLHIDYGTGKGYVLNDVRYIEMASVATGPSADLGSPLKKSPAAADKIVEQLANVRNEVAEITRKEKAVIDDFNSGEQALNKARKRVRTAKSALAVIEAKINDTSGRSEALEKEIRRSEAYAAKRLVSIYKLNWIGKIHLLATADSFFDFVTRKSALETILNQDEQLLQKMHGNQAALEALITEQKARAAEKRALELSLNEHIRNLNQGQQRRAAVLKRIQSEKKLELAALESLKQAAWKLDRTMDTLPPSAIRPPADVVAKPFKEYKGLLSWPVKGKIISFFGPYRNEKYKVINFRSGIDIRAERGEPIRSISAGLTIYANWFKGFGNMIIIDHGEHYYTVYAHLEEVFKVKGDRVEKGEVIATVGDSGSLMGPALHFEVRHHGKPMDPLKWIRKG